MNYSKHMKLKIKAYIWWVFLGFCIGIVPYVIHLAKFNRGYNAIGGELLIPLFPFLILGIWKSIKEMKGVLSND